MILPSFERFFEVVHGYAPFPWQAALAQRVVDEGWPRLLDLPTGAGKTSEIDVALYALAAAPQRAHRRVFLVVDRRIIVHQATQHAKKIRQRLEQADGDGRAIADRLRQLFDGGSDDAPFHVAELRGGMPREVDWAKRPDQPVVGVSTVDQVGSRLLFRGYGVSERMASVHAGLLGNDTLYLLDEVHLAQPFAETLRAIEKRWQPRGSKPYSKPITVVPMSATHGQRDGANGFQLSDEDHSHPVLAKRLNARKPARIHAKTVNGTEKRRREKFADECVKEVEQMLSNGAKVIGVVVNRVDTARAVAQCLLAEQDKRREKLKVVLLTGRMRSLDRDCIMDARDNGRSVAERAMDRNGRAEEGPLVIVATQCIEAGADYDFDGLVTQCASLDALRQRFGRLDRRGAMADSGQIAQAVILMRQDQLKPKRPDPVYGDALPNTYEWLCQQGDTVGVGIREIEQRLPSGSALDACLAPREIAPVLSPTQLNAWAQTSPKPVIDPEVARWLHGPQQAEPEISLVWRADMDEQIIEDAAHHLDGSYASRRQAEIDELLAACPPSSLEALSLPIYAAKAWLCGADAQPAVSDTPVDRRHLVIDEPEAVQPRLAVRWRVNRSEVVTHHDIQPGDTLVVPCSYGGLDPQLLNWAPTSSAAVIDLGDLSQLVARGKPTLRTFPQALRVWQASGDKAIAAALTAPNEEDQGHASDVDEADVVEQWVAHLKDVSLSDIAPYLRESWDRLIKALAPKPHHHRLPFDSYLLTPLLPAKRDRHRDPIIATTEGDDGSFLSEAVSLADHSRDVESWATSFAKNLEMDDNLGSDIALAGWLHDVGKVDPRFQRWLNGGAELPESLRGKPLAKSSGNCSDRRWRQQARRRAGFPLGYRHELLSLSMTEDSEWLREQAHDVDLVLHLVASHHGRCRPFAPVVDRSDDHAVGYQHCRANGDAGPQLNGNLGHGYARLDAGVADRFWRLTERYGWWRLAWFEAILRLADHRASQLGPATKEGDK